MPLPVRIEDPETGKVAKVTSQGQLITGNLTFSSSTQATLAVANTPVKIVTPRAGKIIIITDIILYANRNVGVNDASVQLYESESEAVAKVSTDNVLLNQEIAKQTSLVLTGLNWKVAEGKFLNGVTDDDDVFVNLGCYYADA